jgi:hypothetical protein
MLSQVLALCSSVFIYLKITLTLEWRQWYPSNTLGSVTYHNTTETQKLLHGLFTSMKEEKKKKSW